VTCLTRPLPPFTSLRPTLPSPLPLFSATGGSCPGLRGAGCGPGLRDVPPLLLHHPPTLLPLFLPLRPYPAPHSQPDRDANGFGEARSTVRESAIPVGSRAVLSAVRCPGVPGADSAAARVLRHQTMVRFPPNTMSCPGYSSSALSQDP
jgi:hypothetical protein